MIYRVAAVLLLTEQQTIASHGCDLVLIGSVALEKVLNNGLVPRIHGRAVTKYATRLACDFGEQTWAPERKLQITPRLLVLLLQRTTTMVCCCKEHHILL
jgi:hypothetical protein